MAGSIVDNLMGMLGPRMAGPIASRLGESPDAVQRGLQGAAAAMLAGIASKAEQPGFMSQIFGLITNPANSAGAFSNLTSNPEAVASGAASPLNELGGRFMLNIFGSGQSAITDAIGRFSGLSGSKASSLIAIAAPLVLGFLGQHVRENGLSAGEFGNSLKAESTKLQGFLPPGFGSLLGGVPNVTAASAATPAVVAGGINRWLWPVILVVAILVALIWYFNRSKAPETVETPPPATAPAPSLPAGFYTLKLADGVELNVPENGIENKLVAFITDSSKRVDKTTWFDFDRLTFDTGKDTLQASSQEQLNNVVAILKAYPNVHARIGGYTDNAGKAAANLKLSDDRAKNVMAALVAGGIDKSRLDAKGYGEEHPVASNATEEGRAQNRRISLLVTAK